MDLNLKGKVALVTGGARGLGRAICESLAAEGVNVAVNCRRPEQREKPIAEAAEFVEQIKSQHNVNAVLAGGDVSSSDDVQQMFDLIETTLGPVDILVNNAAIWPSSSIRDMPEDQWNRTIAVNLTGPFLTCRHAVRGWLAEGRAGRIVNIVSRAAFLGSTSGHAHYAAAKAGLVNFTVSLAREVARNRINVNAVAPGLITTDLTEEMFKADKQKYLDSIPLGRIADCSEVADVVVFLASDRAAYVTGATFDVSGGMIMR
jgi:3-oxoacyl-[acyl-carrier protein] reductase